MRWLFLGLRTFLAAGVTFGAIVGLTSRSVGQGLIGGLFFGIFMAAVLTALTRHRRGSAPESLSMRQRVHLTLDAPLEAAHARAIDALTDLPAKITSDIVNRIVGRTKPSWSSWGEIVTIDLQERERATQLTIESRPRLRTTVVDYGRNHDNVVSLASDLQ